jgi:hypothetical protein
MTAQSTRSPHSSPRTLAEPTYVLCRGEVLTGRLLDVERGTHGAWWLRIARDPRARGARRRRIVRVQVLDPDHAVATAFAACRVPRRARAPQVEIRCVSDGSVRWRRIQFPEGTVTYGHSEPDPHGADLRVSIGGVRAR